MPGEIVAEPMENSDQQIVQNGRKKVKNHQYFIIS